MRRRPSIPVRAVWVLAAIGCLVRLVECPATAADPPAAAPAQAPAAASPPAPAADDAAGDLARKAEIMDSSRWRRAIFELGEWLSTQQIYTPEQVRRIKADFNRRVAGMSSYELEYLLDDLDAKFKVMDTPEAQDARAWVGQYLSAMSDRKRAETLKDVPNVVAMSAGQLQQEILQIERVRDQLRQQQADFDRGRDQLVQQAAAARQATAAAATAAMARANTGGATFSPYRSHHGGKPPHSGAKIGPGISLGIGPGGAYFGFGSL